MKQWTFNTNFGFAMKHKLPETNSIYISRSITGSDWAGSRYQWFHQRVHPRWDRARTARKRILQWPCPKRGDWSAQSSLTRQREAAPNLRTENRAWISRDWQMNWTTDPRPPPWSPPPCTARPAPKQRTPIYWSPLWTPFASNSQAPVHQSKSKSLPSNDIYDLFYRERERERWIE